MYNLWCEIDRRVPLMIIVGVLFSFGLHLINSDYYTAILLLTIFLILYFINRILKYLSLKFRGKLIHDIPYEFKQINNKEKILIVNFQLPNGNYVRLKFYVQTIENKIIILFYLISFILIKLLNCISICSLVNIFFILKDFLLISSSPKTIT